MGMPGWDWIDCSECGREELVMVRSRAGETGHCTRCLAIAEGRMDRAGNWVGVYARYPVTETVTGKAETA